MSAPEVPPADKSSATRHSLNRESKSWTVQVLEHLRDSRLYRPLTL